MESDVEEGEIRESECLSPLSEDENESAEVLSEGCGTSRQNQNRRRRFPVRHRNNNFYRKREQSNFRRNDNPVSYRTRSISNRTRSVSTRATSSPSNNNDRKSGGAKNQLKPNTTPPARRSPLPNRNRVTRKRSTSPNPNPVNRKIPRVHPPSDVQVNGVKSPKTSNNDDSEVELVSVVDKSTREVELIVIDSASSSESESEDNTDFEDNTVPDTPNVDNVEDLNLSNVSDVVKADVQGPPQVPELPPDILQNLIVPPVPPPPTDLAKVTTEDDDIETLELRKQALEGLLMSRVSSQLDQSEAPSILGDSVYAGTECETQTNVEPMPNTSSASIVIGQECESDVPNSNTNTEDNVDSGEKSATIPDDNEKENELELFLLRSKLLSDLEKKNKKRTAVLEASKVAAKCDKPEKSLKTTNPVSKSSVPRSSYTNGSGNNSKATKIPHRDREKSPPLPPLLTYPNNLVVTPKPTPPTLNTLSVSVSKDGSSRTVCLATAQDPPLQPELTAPSNPKRIVQVIGNSELPNAMPGLRVQKFVSPASSASSGSSKGKEQVNMKVSPLVTFNPTNLLPNFTRTVMNPNALKSKYTRNLVLNTPRLGLAPPNPSKRKYQSIVIPIRDGDQSTDEEEDTSSENSNSKESTPVRTNGTPILTPGFHSSLDRFLKSVRESASKNRGKFPIPATATEIEKRPSSQPSTSGEQSKTGPVRPQTAPSDKSTTKVGKSPPKKIRNEPARPTTALTDPDTTKLPKTPIKKTNTEPKAPTNNTGTTELANSPPKTITNELVPPHTAPTDKGTAKSANLTKSSPKKITTTNEPAPPQAAPSDGDGTDVTAELPESPQKKTKTFRKRDTAAMSFVWDDIDFDATNQQVITPQTAAEIPTDSTGAVTPTTSATSETPTSSNTRELQGQNLVKQATQTRNELHLREKLLRATLLRKEEQLKLSSTEREFVHIRQSATNFLGSAIDKINKHSEWTKQCGKIDDHVTKLRKQLELAERSLLIKVRETSALHHDAMTTIKKSFDMRGESVGVATKCKVLGQQLNGDQYKVPSVGAGDMLTKVREIYKLTTNENVAKKGPVNLKKLEMQIIKAFSSKQLLGIANSLSTSSLPELPNSVAGGEVNLNNSRESTATPPSTTCDETEILDIEPQLVFPGHEKILGLKYGAVKLFGFGIYVPYVSPLGVIKDEESSRQIENCKATVCRDDMSGGCKRADCKYQHLPREVEA